MARRAISVGGRRAAGAFRRLLPVTALAVAALAAPVMGGAALAVELPSEGRLLVASQAEGVVQIFDVPSAKLLARVPVGDDPRDLVVTPDGRKAYVSVRDGVAVIQVGTGKKLRTIRADNFKSVLGLGLSPDGRRLLIASEGNRRLFLVDTARDVIVSGIGMAAPPRRAAVGRSGKRAWISTPAAGSVSLVRVPDLRVLRKVDVGSAPEGIVETSNGRWALVALQGTDQVAILNADNGDVLARLPAGRRPVSVVATPDGWSALTANQGSADVTVFDVLGRRVVGTVGVGAEPTDVTVNTRGSRAYVCNRGSGTVSVIALAAHEVSGTIAVAARPVAVGFAPLPVAAHPPRGGKDAATRPKGGR